MHELCKDNKAMGGSAAAGVQLGAGRQADALWAWAALWQGKEDRACSPSSSSSSVAVGVKELIAEEGADDDGGGGA